MSAGMADIIAAHTPVWECLGGGEDDRSWLECSCRTFANDDWTGDTEADHAAHVAEELTKAGYGNVQAKGYLIVDKVTGALDWDGELHPTVEAAISSLCGPHQSFCRDPEDFTGDDTTYWADVYAIHPVSAPLDPNLAAALADPEGHALVKAIHDRKAEA